MCDLHLWRKLDDWFGSITELLDFCRGCGWGFDIDFSLVHMILHCKHIKSTRLCRFSELWILRINNKIIFPFIVNFIWCVLWFHCLQSHSGGDFFPSLAFWDLRSPDDHPQFPCIFVSDILSGTLLGALWSHNMIYWSSPQLSHRHYIPTHITTSTKRIRNIPSFQTNNSN